MNMITARAYLPFVVDIDADFRATFFFSLLAVALSIALLTTNPNAFAALGVY
jgi:hypothetical protein